MISRGVGTPGMCLLIPQRILVLLVEAFSCMCRPRCCCQTDRVGHGSILGVPGEVILLATCFQKYVQGWVSTFHSAVYSPSGSNLSRVII